MKAIIFDWRGIEAKLGDTVLSSLMRGEAVAALTAYEAGLFNVYTFETDTENPLNKDGVFRILNIEHPEGYRDRSMSVGDLVIEDNNRTWICKPFGWANISIAFSPFITA
jgi:hypothetical protein